MRFLLQSLKVLVIDEISMVGLPMLEDINVRSQLIMGTADTTLYGEVSVLAVGDFHQLPPVRKQPVYALSKDSYRKMEYFCVAKFSRFCLKNMRINVPSF